MMTLAEVYEECERKNIDIDYFPMNKAVALSFPEGFIAIDTDKIKNSIEEKEILAHEESHIETGSFYNFYSPIDIKGKHEHRAEINTIKKLVPVDELKEAVSCGFIEIWDLAEYFDVSDKFMTNAVKYYKDNNLIN